jgi:sphinganine-1-phosphate aldolase
MEAMARDDIAWRRGRAPLYVFYATEEVYEVGREAFFKFFAENALGGRRAFFSVRRMEEEIVDIALDLFHAPVGACGHLTTGGSESIFLAVQAARKWARSARPGAAATNMVIPFSTHPAFNKAADALDIEVRRIPLGDDLRADVDAMAAAVDDETILLIGSAPCFPHGVIDDIPALGRLALERGLWLHVDACVGGYIAPFAARLRNGFPAFDLGVAGVRSLSADLHKFGFCPKPASTVFYGQREDYERQVFDFDDWPNGRFTTATLSGTRAGGAVAAAWAVLHHLGRDGYREITRQVLEMTRRYVAGIEAIDGLRMWARPDLSIINFGSAEVDIFAVADRLAQRGWLPGLTRRPAGLHVMLSLIHEPVLEEYLADLEHALREARAGIGPSAPTVDAEY